MFIKSPWRRFVTKLIIMISLIAFNEGCLKLVYIIPTEEEEEKLSKIEGKSHLLHDNMNELNIKNVKFEDRIIRQDLENEQLSEEYAQLSSKQLAIESLKKSHSIEREMYKKELLKTRKSISGFEDKLIGLKLEEERLRKENEKISNLLNSADALYKRGKYEEAIVTWKEALELNPTYVDAVYNIGFARDRIKERQSRLEN